jgi:hypothetical protein
MNVNKWDDVADTTSEETSKKAAQIDGARTEADVSEQTECMVAVAKGMEALWRAAVLGL